MTGGVPARLAEFLQALLRDDVPAGQHHRWVGFRRLFLRNWTSKDRMVSVLRRQGYLNLLWKGRRLYMSPHDAARDTHRKFARLAPLALSLSHDFPPLLNTRQSPTTTNVADDTQWCLPAHTKVGTVLGGEHALQIYMHRGVGEVGVRRLEQLVHGHV